MAEASRLSSQAAHRVDLDVKHLGRLGRNLPTQLLKDHGARFNKQRHVWEVPAFSNLFPFMPYISKGARMTTVDCVFSKLEARVQARLETECSQGFMVLPGKVRGPVTRVLRLPKAPPGYKWESAPVDSGCTALLKTSSNGFTSVNPHSTRTVRVANNEVIPVSGEGTFQFTAVCDKGKLHAFSAKHAVYAPGLRNLISGGIFEDQGHEVSLKGDKSQRQVGTAQVNPVFTGRPLLGGQGGSTREDFLLQVDV